MDPVSVSTLVIACLSLVASVITPIILATSHFIDRVNKSTCCGGEVDLDPVNPIPLNQPLILNEPVKK